MFFNVLRRKKNKELCQHAWTCQEEFVSSTLVTHYQKRDQFRHENRTYSNETFKTAFLCHKDIYVMKSLLLLETMRLNRRECLQSEL